jgi:hypothetical protein
MHEVMAYRLKVINVCEWRIGAPLGCARGCGSEEESLSGFVPGVETSGYYQPSPTGTLDQLIRTKINWAVSPVFSCLSFLKSNLCICSVSYLALATDIPQRLKPGDCELAAGINVCSTLCKDAVLSVTKRHKFIFRQFSLCSVAQGWPAAARNDPSHAALRDSRRQRLRGMLPARGTRVDLTI